MATTAAVCRAIRPLVPAGVGMWAKLSPDAPDPTEVGIACRESGVDAVTVSNTYPAPPDPRRHLGGGNGGMSGAILQPHVRSLIEKFTSTHPDLPVIACGGVISSDVALEYLHLGAVAVQVGTASLFDPRAAHKIARNVVRRLREESRGNG